MSIRTSAAAQRSAAARPSPPLDAGVRLRRDWHARLKPVDEAERAAVDAIVATVICRLHLAPVEMRVLDRLAQGSCEPGMPSLSTLCRFRARLEKDRLMADQELAELQALRPREIPHPSLNPDRLEWLADHLRRRGGVPRPAAPTAAPAPDAPPFRTRDTRAAPAASADGPDPDRARDTRAAPVEGAEPPAGPPDSAPEPPAADPANAAASESTPEAAGDPRWAVPPRRRSRATGPLLPPPARPRVDWLSSTSTYALAAAQLAAGRP